MYQPSASWHHMQNEVDRQCSPAAAIALIDGEQIDRLVYAGKVMRIGAETPEFAHHAFRIITFDIDLLHQRGQFARQTPREPLRRRPRPVSSRFASPSVDPT